jgi:phage/plasmid-like protein (TIGR03299 family)
MAHNLYRGRMAFTGEMPWHHLGVAFKEKFTTEEAIKAAALDFEVNKEQLLRQNGTPAPAFATINNFNNEVLGIVGNDYQIIQNTEAFEFFNELIGQGEAFVETAGALGNGERVWMLTRLPNTFSPLVGDRIKQYCLLFTSHDGSLNLSVSFTAIRVVCQNTLAMALHDKSTHQVVKIKHTTNAAERIKTAAQILKEANKYFTALGAMCERFASYKIDDDFINEYIVRMFGKSEDFAEGRSRSIFNRKLEMFQSRRENGMGTHIPGVKETAWGLLNAAVEYADYDLPRLGTDPANCVLFGSGAKFKQEAYDEMLVLVGAPVTQPANHVDENFNFD